MEDHVSMGMHAGLHAYKLLRNTENILAIEYLIAGQALDLREGYKLAEGSERALELLRSEVPFMEQDRVLSIDIEKATELLNSGKLHDKAARYLD
jgi:histidine ammonia-lyase